MQREFDEKLAEENGNVTHLLDKATHECEDYFKYKGLQDKDETSANCSTIFRTHHYGLGGKCFLSKPFANLSQRDLTFQLTNYPDSLNLNKNIAEESSLKFGTYSIYFMNHPDDLYNYDYNDITPVSVNEFTYIMLTRITKEMTYS